MSDAALAKADTAKRALQVLAKQAKSIEQALEEDAENNKSNGTAAAYISIPKYSDCRVMSVGAIGDEFLRFSGQLADGHQVIITQHVSLTAIVFRFGEAPVGEEPERRLDFTINNA